MRIPKELSDLGFVERDPGQTDWSCARKPISRHVSVDVWFLDGVQVDLRNDDGTVNEACRVVDTDTLDEALPCIKALLALPIK